jgi:hypothetical protein
MFWLKKTKPTSSIIIGILISSVTFWTETASAQSVVDLIKLPIDLIKDKVPDQLPIPNANTSAFDSNLNNNTLNFCLFPCGALPGGGSGMAGVPGGVPGMAGVPGGVPQGGMVAPRPGVPMNGMAVPGNAVRPQGPSPTLSIPPIQLPPIDLQKLF